MIPSIRRKGSTGGYPIQPQQPPFVIFSLPGGGRLDFDSSRPLFTSAPRFSYFSSASSLHATTRDSWRRRRRRRNLLTLLVTGITPSDDYFRDADSRSSAGNYVSRRHGWQSPRTRFDHTSTSRRFFFKEGIGYVVFEESILL